MTSREHSTSAGSVQSAKPDFSLVLGGPLFQLLRRSSASDDVIELVKKRVVFISLFTWLPLLGLATGQGKLLAGSVAVPFALDIELHVRFLIALPLLIIAELLVHERMRTVVQLFRDRGLIPDAATARFEAAIESSFRLRNSVVAELALVAIVYGVGIQLVWRQFIALGSATWYATPTADGSTLTLAGMWYGYVSLPIFQFLFVRWYFRIFIWARFLFRVFQDRAALGPDPSRSPGRARVSCGHGLRVHAAGCCARRDARRSAGEPHLLCRGEVLGLSARSRFACQRRVVCGVRALVGVHPSARASEADRHARVRHTRTTLRASLRREVAARESGARRVVAREPRS